MEYGLLLSLLPHFTDRLRIFHATSSPLLYIYTGGHYKEVHFFSSDFCFCTLCTPAAATAASLASWLGSRRFCQLGRVVNYRLDIQCHPCHISFLGEKYSYFSWIIHDYIRFEILINVLLRNKPTVTVIRNSRVANFTWHSISSLSYFLLTLINMYSYFGYSWIIHE